MDITATRKPLSLVVAAVKVIGAEDPRLPVSFPAIEVDTAGASGAGTLGAADAGELVV